MPYLLNFDGTNEYVSFGNSGTAQFNLERTASWSMGVQFRSTHAANMVLLGKTAALTPSTSVARGYELNIDSAGHVGWNLNGNNTSHFDEVRTNGANLLDGKFHWAIVTYNGSVNVSGMLIYIDGVLAATTTISSTLTGADTLLNTGIFALGIRSVTSILDRAFQGDLYYPFFFSKVLSAPEVLQINTEGGIAAISSLVGLWSGDGSVHPTLLDMSQSNTDGTMVNMEAADIVARDFVPTSAAPVISNVTPLGSLSRFAPWQFRVTDDTGLAGGSISVRFPGRPTETVWTSTFGFEAGYSSSSKNPTAGGYDFSVVRTGGWPAPPSFFTPHWDLQGQLNA